MVNHAKSDSKKRQIARETKNDLMARAVVAYKNELTKTPIQRPKGARTVCTDFENLYHLQTGLMVKLSHTTLIHLAQGGRSRMDADAQRSWVMEEEERVLIDFIGEIGNRGFPLSHRRLKEHVDEILRARLGTDFPEGGVGVNWTARFVEKHSNEIKMSFSRPLESKRGRAVNPATNEAWFDLLGDTQEKYGLRAETTWAADESGFHAGAGQRERVMGARKQEPQYQQRDGNRENMTVIVTICGDGTALAPTMIFKGSAFQASWKQDNPANATLGYSKKGWTDGEIGVEWIKDFDCQTKHTVEPGEYRCLLVDGHNSHYTRGFLEYARTHQILVLCYPAHTTHIYQGLDVVIFSVLKKCLSEERDRYERETGEKISKKNFLTVYGRAHLQALTSDNVKAAFRKTGVWPYDRSVVTTEMMAPSKETSCEGSLPVVPPTPVRAVAKLLQKLSIIDKGSDSDDDTPGSPTVAPARLSAIPEDPTPTALSVPELAAQETLEQLSQTRLAFLLQNAPPPAGSQLPTTSIKPIPCMTSLHADTLAMEPKTAREKQLFAALLDSEARAQAQYSRVLELQAAAVLNQMYCDLLRKQLAHKEEQKGKGKGKGRLVGDGMPRLLTSDEFYERVVDFQAAQEQADREKAARKVARKDRDGVLGQWKEREAARKLRNVAIRDRNRKALTDWEEAKKAAKAANKPFKDPKPKPQSIESPEPKPSTVVEADAGSGEEFEGLDDDDDDED